MNGKYYVSVSSNNCVWTVMVPWCCQVMVHNSHSAFFPDSETVGSFFTVVHSPGTPKFYRGKKKPAHKIGMSVMNTISFIYHTTEKSCGTMGYEEGVLNPFMYYMHSP